LQFSQKKKILQKQPSWNNKANIISVQTAMDRLHTKGSELLHLIWHVVTNIKTC